VKEDEECKKKNTRRGEAKRARRSGRREGEKGGGKGGGGGGGGGGLPLHAMH